MMSERRLESIARPLEIRHVEVEAQFPEVGSVKSGDHRQLQAESLEDFPGGPGNLRPTEAVGDFEEVSPGRKALFEGDEACANELDPPFEVDGGTVHLAVGADREG